jgi:hypothetical protein
VREELAALKSAAPDLPRRFEMARRLASQQDRIEQLQRECASLRHSAQTRTPEGPRADFPVMRADSFREVDENGATIRPVVETAVGHFPAEDGIDAGESALLEENLGAADLVICQAGCISHGAYWRVQDYCKRTGKPCVLIEQSAALRILRIHPRQRGAEVADGLRDEGKHGVTLATENDDDGARGVYGKISNDDGGSRR